MTTGNNTETRKAKWIKWLKRLGFWGFLFFLLKGLFWLALAYWVVKK
jgi:predicted AlkP superfamily phosphohydrolase/phosphomutase